MKMAQRHTIERERSMTNIHSYDPRAGHRLRQDPLNAIIAPRPIGWISSASAGGVSNLAPYSFFNVFNYTPPVIGFSSEGWKDTAENISQTGEFVWSLVTENLATKMNRTSARLAADVDEFEFADLTPLPSCRVKPKRVAESPVNFECKLTQMLQLKSADGSSIDSWLVLGEVVMIHIDEALVADGFYNTVAGAPVLRGGGPSDYFRISEQTLFKMDRPPGAERTER